MIATISKFSVLVMPISILVLLIRGDLFSLAPLAIIAQVGAVALSIWARRSFAQGQFSVHSAPAQGPMMSAGPYRYIRHPMYAAALLLLWAGILSHWSGFNVLIGVVVIFFISFRIADEERKLREHFPNYASYTTKTKRLVPFIL